MQAWLTPSKAAGMLPPSAHGEEQDMLSQQSCIGGTKRAPEQYECSQKVPFHLSHQQKDGLIQAQHLHNLHCDSGEHHSIVSNSTSPPSPRGAITTLHRSRSGPADSQAERSPSDLEGHFMSSIDTSGQMECNNLQHENALSGHQRWATCASGSSSNSSHSEDAAISSMDPYLMRHLCLQELELLWSKDSSEVRSSPRTRCPSCGALASPCMHPNTAQCYYDQHQHCWELDNRSGSPCRSYKITETNAGAGARQNWLW